MSSCRRVWTRRKGSTPAPGSQGGPGSGWFPGSSRSSDFLLLEVKTGLKAHFRMNSRSSWTRWRVKNWRGRLKNQQTSGSLSETLQSTVHVFEILYKIFTLHFLSFFKSVFLGTEYFVINTLKSISFHVFQFSAQTIFRLTVVWVTCLNWQVLSPDPALCASLAHECCSPAPRRIPARLRFRPCRFGPPNQGSHEDPGAPPSRFWARLGDLGFLWGERSQVTNDRYQASVCKSKSKNYPLRN